MDQRSNHQIIYIFVHLAPEIALTSNDNFFSIHVLQIEITTGMNDF